METKEDFFEEILASTKGMSRLKAPEHLYEKINAAARTDQDKTKEIWIWLAAASVVLLVNFACLIQWTSNNKGVDEISVNNNDIEIFQGINYNY